MNKSFNNIPLTGSTTIPIICLDDIYNIFTIEQPTTGTLEEYTLTVNNTLSADTNGQYYISFLGNSISNVILPQNAKGSYFYIKQNSTTSTAVSIANALRACPNINASFVITFDNNEVTLKARNYGNVDERLQTNILSSDMTVTYTQGTIDDDIVNSNVNVEIYDENMTYLTTLSKTFIKDDVAFNISPVLSTFAEYGKMKQYYLECYYVGNDGLWNPSQVFYCYHTKGYKTPYSEKYISGGTKILLAHPDNYKLWTYGNKIDYTLFTGFGVGRTQVVYTCYGSDESVIYRHTDTITPSMGSPEYQDLTFEIPAQSLSDIYKIKIEAGNDSVLIYVIKPLKMAPDATRVEWRNEYGGISYFDFTGQKSDSISTTKADYKKNIYDYYTSSEYEEEKVYNIDKTTEYTLNSHIVEENSLYILQSLSLAKKVWIKKDNDNIPIIITSIGNNKENNYSTVYTMQIKYKKSYENAED